MVNIQNILQLQASIKVNENLVKSARDAINWYLNEKLADLLHTVAVNVARPQANGWFIVWDSANDMSPAEISEFRQKMVTFIGRALFFQ